MSRGSVVGVHDPPMGWSAYGQSMACPMLDPAVVALHPTAPAAELAAQLANRLLGCGADCERSRPSGSLAFLLTQLVHQPAPSAGSRAGVEVARDHPETGRARRRTTGTRARACRCACCGATASSEGGASSGADTSRPPQRAATRRRRSRSSRGPAWTRRRWGRVQTTSFAARSSPRRCVLRARSSQPSACDSHRAPHLSKAREAVLERGCRAQPRDEGSAAPRPLNDILQPGDAFPKPSACAADENMRALCELLKEAAIGREAPRRPPPGSSPSLHGTTREPAPLCTVGLL